MPASKPAAPAEQGLRTFVALPLPAPLKGALAEVIEGLAAAWPGAAVRWVRPQNLHLTLRFLGVAPLGKLAAIAAALESAATQTAPFSLALAGLDSFPNRRQPRVVWVGVRDEADGLAPLKAAIDRRLAPLGWPLEKRPFEAHLTLGRVKGRQAVRGDWSTPVPPLAFAAGPLQLVESQLQRTGPVYRIRNQYSFLAG